MDSIFNDFLEHTTKQAQELAADSDVLVLDRLAIPGEAIFVAEFLVPYLCRTHEGDVKVDAGPVGVAVRLTPEYLRSVSPLEVAQVREPYFFHPNIRWPGMCVGDVRPGMPLAKLLKHIFEIVTYQNFATDDGLNPEACARLRDQPQLLDMLPKPPRLVRRKLQLS